jgi:hypothetical protein
VSRWDLCLTVHCDQHEANFARSNHERRRIHCPQNDAFHPLLNNHQYLTCFLLLASTCLVLDQHMLVCEPYSRMTTIQQSMRSSFNNHVYAPLRALVDMRVIFLFFFFLPPPGAGATLELPSPERLASTMATASSLPSKSRSQSCSHPSSMG